MKVGRNFVPRQGFVLCWTVRGIWQLMLPVHAGLAAAARKNVPLFFEKNQADVISVHRPRRRAKKKMFRFFEKKSG